MHINLIWDPSVDAAPAGFKEAIGAASAVLDRTIRDPFEENIRVGYGEIGGVDIVPGILAAGGPLGGASETYEQVVAHLAAHANTAFERQEIATLPSVAPKNWPVGGLYVAPAQLKAWGLMDPKATDLDGQVGFSSLYSYALDLGHRAVPGLYDLNGVAKHEITHTLGRIYGDGPLGLINYTGPGVFGDLGTVGGYFSVDGGKTNLAEFAKFDDVADLQTTGDGNAFNYITLPGTENNLTKVDNEMLGALGFDVRASGHYEHGHGHHHGRVGIRCCHASVKMHFV